MIIDRNIHQIWYQSNTYNTVTNTSLQRHNIDVPKKYINNSLSWISNNRGWKYILWNNKRIIELLYNYYPEYYKYYKNLHPIIKRIDFAKYVILYHYGGIYCDMDTVCLKSIDNLLKYFNKYNLIISKSPKLNLLEKTIIYKYFDINNNIDLLNNGIMLSKKNHPFWKDIINIIIKNKKNSYLFPVDIFNHTGLIMLTKGYHNIKNRYTDIAIANNIFLEPCCSYDYTCEPSMLSYSNHSHDSLWIKQNISNSNIIKYCINNLLQIISYTYFKFFRNLKKIFIFIISITIIILILFTNQ
jgi:mannosyltransferase OCH1-like enzyme